jgi:hypothetical protein
MEYSQCIHESIEIIQSVIEESADDKFYYISLMRYRMSKLSYLIV